MVSALSSLVVIVVFIIAFLVFYKLGHYLEEAGFPGPAVVVISIAAGCFTYWLLGIVIIPSMLA